MTSLSFFLLSWFLLLCLSVSEVPKVNAPPPKYTSQEILEMKSDQEKKEEVGGALLKDMSDAAVV